MEPPFADSSDVSLALVGPSNSGTDWANRDREALYRRPGRTAAPYRRPPAAQSPSDDLLRSPATLSPGDDPRRSPATPSPGDDLLRSPAILSPGDDLRRSPAASPPGDDKEDMADSGSWNAFAAPSAGRREPSPEAPQRVPEPEFGPAPPATGGRTAFGVTAGPISGNWRDEPLPTRSYGTEPTFSDEPAPERARHSRPAPPALPASPASPFEGDDGVGDLIGGPGHEIRPHRATRHPAAPAGQPPAPRRSRGVLIAGLALTTAVLFGATVAGVTYFAGPDKDLTSVLELGTGDKAEQRTATAPMAGRTAAGFDLVSAVSRVTVRSEDLGDQLYRVTTADDSGVLPKPVLDDDEVQLYLTPEGDEGVAGAVDVVLSTRVTWTLRFSGAADEQILNLQGGRVAGIDMLGRARRTAIQLPAAAGTVPLKVTGAVDELAMTSPAGNPVRVQVKGGAKTVAAGARTLRDVEPGSTLTPKNWATNDRYDVNAEARVTLLSVETVE